MQTHLPYLLFSFGLTASCATNATVDGIAAEAIDCPTMSEHDDHGEAYGINTCGPGHLWRVSGVSAQLPYHGPDGRFWDCMRGRHSEATPDRSCLPDTKLTVQLGEGYDVLGLETLYGPELVAAAPGVSGPDLFDYQANDANPEWGELGQVAMAHAPGGARGKLRYTLRDVGIFETLQDEDSKFIGENVVAFRCGPADADLDPDVDRVEAAAVFGNSRLFEIPQGARHFSASSIPIRARGDGISTVEHYCGEGSDEDCTVTFEFDYIGALPLD